MPACLLLLFAWFVPAQAAPQGARRVELAELVARDARLEFTPESARRARGVLEAAPAAGRDQVEERAVALLALGCGGAGGDVARIEARLTSGELNERRAALFSLGELGNPGWPALARANTGDIAGLEEALCVAVAVAARRGVGAADEHLWSLANGDDDLERPAAQAIRWRAEEGAGGLEHTLALYYELRWRAARAYGLVDGRRASQAFAAELYAHEEFLDRVVLAAAAALPAAALKAHLAEILQAGERPGALRVAALVMPDELERALRDGEWQPSPAGWRALLAEIDARRAERGTKPLLTLAFQASTELEPIAGRLLFRGGADLPWSWVLDQLERGDPEQRALLLEACGDRGQKELVPALAELREERADLGVSAPALVALARLGHASAREELEAAVQAAPNAERAQVLGALARAQHDRDLRRFADRALEHEDLARDVRADLVVALAESGAPVEREELRSALGRVRDPARRLACVRALAQEPEPADVEALAALFPVEGDLELNIELALALLDQRHPATGGLLAAALWGTDWNRSVLAGGLIVARSGPRGLLDEIESAPSTAGERELRRAGFALGEWGGLAAVEALARSRSEGDPVLQGALLGALSSRAGGDGETAQPRPRVQLGFPAGGGGDGGGGSKAPAKGGKGKKKRP